jgi:5-methylcytosine-specific restriction endonuclease McrBC GTP-binding regulatory subunit McrB
MTRQDINKLNGCEFSTMESAENSISQILSICGVKEVQQDSYVKFITLDKNILTGVGNTLYSIWIKKTYTASFKEVFVISMQKDYSYSMTIKPYILQAIGEGKLILTDEMNTILNAVNN